MMGTMRQIEPVGYLPPSKEVLLEIQVSKFIKDFLFSGVDDCKTAVSSSLSRVDRTTPVKPQLGVQSSSAFEVQARFGQKENNPTSEPCTSPWKPDISQQNEAVFVEMPTQTSIRTDKIPSACCQSASELDRIESERFFDSSSVPGEIRIKMDEQCEEGTEVGTKTCVNNTSLKHNGKWTETKLGKATTGSEDGANPVSSGYQALAIEGREGKKMHITQISRTETFPCKSKTQRERQFICIRNDSNGVCDVGTEIKHSCRKPPRPPPRLTRQSSSDQEGCSGLLTRCASDTNLLLQSSRRAKMERKRKMAAAASTVTSLWALIITLCFAVAMIVQGVSSQGSRTLSMKTANASSLSNTPPSVKMNLPASLLKASLSDRGQGNSGFDSSKWTEEGEGDVQRERTTQGLPILKGFDTQSSGTSTS